MQPTRVCGYLAATVAATSLTKPNTVSGATLTTTPSGRLVNVASDREARNLPFVETDFDRFPARDDLPDCSRKEPAAAEFVEEGRDRVLHPERPVADQEHVGAIGPEEEALVTEFVGLVDLQ